ncbi:TIM barrel protein [Chitinibacter sp. FCG-7]|uniref:TIM barrel protein n=1 Tax=Chitinibacter mangrovi TaxID=3153927 RepID=A0AAU7FC12_9NEIS
MIAAAGFDDVAVFYNQSNHGPAIAVTSDSSAADIAAARLACANAGLNPSLLLAGEWPASQAQSKSIAQYQRLIANAHQLGASALLDFGCESPALLPGYLALMEAIAPMAQEAGISITIKPHGGISTQPKQLLALKEILQSDVFMLSFDPGNLLYYSQGQIKPEDCLALLAPFSGNLIIKDYLAGPAGPTVQLNPGDGCVDFPALLQGFARYQFSGHVYLECVAGEQIDEIHRNVQLSQQRITQWISSSTELESAHSTQP